jgi:methionyl-tRNA synthetase
MKTKYITTAIPYTNARPHIGHAMDYLLGDVWFRYQKQRGEEVLFSAGLDEHGTKIANKAREEGKTPQEFVDKLTPIFQDFLAKMDISYTQFVRTTDEEHKRRCQEIWRRLDKAGVIYKAKYGGWYCAGCESFVTETEAKAMNYECPNHTKLEKVEDENYFLKISQFTEEIRRFSEKIVPSWRGKEIRELIKNGAQDVSISRSKEKLAWGIPVPGDEDQVMYVWVEALSNYITVLDQGVDDESWWKNLESGKVWPAEVEIIGKDILRFHAIIWPAMLLALGLELPKTLLAHGFVNLTGEKMSKSVGNVVYPTDVIDKYGVDAFRYFFLRHIPTFEDGDYTEEKFTAVYNGELANDLGNLVSRLANMVNKYLGGKIGGVPDRVFKSEKFTRVMEEFRFDVALEEVWLLVRRANKYIDEKKPWELAKLGKKEDLEAVLEELVAEMREIGSGLEPFLPNVAGEIRRIFWGDDLGEAGILFPKVDGH